VTFLSFPVPKYLLQPRICGLRGQVFDVLQCPGASREADAASCVPFLIRGSSKGAPFLTKSVFSSTF